MSILASDAEKSFLANNYERCSATTKVIEFASRINARRIYLRLGQGFPSHADVVVHPEVDAEPLLRIEGVEHNKRVEFRHGDHMTSFPKHIHGGEKPVHYGRALQVNSVFALNNLCEAYHRL